MNKTIGIASCFMLCIALPAIGENAASNAVQSLDSPNPVVQSASLDAMRKALVADPRTAADVERSRLPDALMKAARYDDAADICLLCVNAQPGRLDRTEYFLRLRTRALLEARRYDEALAAAKSLYNVAPIRATPQAIELVARALAAARPEQPGIDRRFKLQQLVAASTSPTDDLELDEPILKTIAIDASVYDTTPLTAERNREWRALGQGNLALMCDRPRDAMALFTTLAKSSNPEVQKAAVEAIARATKATDFGLRNANAYLVQGVSGNAETVIDP